VTDTPGPDPRFEREAYLAVAWADRDEPDVPELRTERLLLRAWLPDDRVPFAALNADPEVMEHFPGPMSRSASNALLVKVRAHFAAHGYGLWAVEAPEGFVGFTGLQWSDWSGTRELEIGWRLARSAWGKGYATEAATAALAYGLGVVPRVVSFTALSNVRSQAVMKRIGLVREREFDHPREDLPERLRRHVLYATPPGDG
jgi:ribosomal-protein-alanine N-acetyltransferase